MFPLRLNFGQIQFLTRELPLSIGKISIDFYWENGVFMLVCSFLIELSSKDRHKCLKYSSLILSAIRLLTLIKLLGPVLT